MTDDQSRRSGSTDTDVSTDAPLNANASDAQGVTGMSPSALITGASVVVFAILLRTGITNLIFVPLCAAILLLNPWVRLFLGLEAVREEDEGDESRKTSFDPIHLVQFLTGSDNSKSRRGQSATSKDNEEVRADEKIRLDRSGAYAALRRMPANLRRPISDLEELIIRDCICSWYNYHSFGDPSLPNEARFSIDHGIGSLFHALEDAKSADVMAELMLAAASVLLVTLRYKRIHPKRAPIFANDAQRIQALREALDRVFARHFRRDDANCDLMRTLLREIICKQIWNAICGVGEPDFINQQIVQWHEREQNGTGTGAILGTGAVLQNGLSAVPQASNGIGTHTQKPEPLQSTTPQSSNLSRRASPQASNFTSPERQASPVNLRSVGDMSTTTQEHATIQREEAPTSSPTPQTQLSGGELRTTQPRAMAMPSPLARSAYSMSATTTPSALASTPILEHPSPSLIRSKRQDTSAAPTAPILASKQMSITRESPTSSRITKPVFAAATPDDIGDEAMLAWDDVMPMNVPPTAHQGMLLPESLRKSMRSSQDVPRSPTEHRSATDSQEGYRIPDGISEGSKDSALAAQLNAGERSSIDSRSSRPFSPPARSNNSSDQHLPKPPSRAPSAASGGIPPAPDMAEVLSNKLVSAGYTALRDAFESFLERGGVANRSLFFSPPSAATVAPGEGMALLRLHVGLNAIARLVPAPSEERSEGMTDVNEDYLYRDDALGILQKGLESLVETDEGSVAGRALREAAYIAVQRLENDGQARIRDVTAPVERALWTRLHGLYEHFWKDTCTRPAGVRQATLGSNPASGSNTPARESFSPEPTTSSANWSRNSREFRRQLSDFEARGSSTDAGELQYEPRRKHFKSPVVKNVGLPEASLERVRGDESIGSPSTSVQPLPSNAPVTEGGQALAATPSRPSLKKQQQPSHGPTITVTDVSVNAERPKAPVDLRTYEVMIAVEGLASESGGFVLLRHWKDFQQLDEELKRVSTTLPPLAVQMPTGRGKNSDSLTAELQTFLQQLLVSPLHTTSHAVQYFVDKARAGEEASADRMNVLLDSLQLGKGLDFGKNLATGVVNSLQKGTRAAVNRAGSFPTPISLGNVEGKIVRDPSSEGAEGAPRHADGAPHPRGESTDHDTITPQLAHLPIGVRKSQGRMSENVPQGLGIEATSHRVSSTKEGTKSNATSNRDREEEDRPEISAPASNGLEAPRIATPSTISSDDLDNFLSCIFAIADEAFSLSGGWTFRRGMLRVFEQIVRTQYWSSILGVFNNAAQSVTSDQLGKWCTDIKVKFWPDEQSNTAAGGQGGLDSQPSMATNVSTTKKVDEADEEATPVEALGEAVVEAAIEASQGNEDPTSNGVLAGGVVRTPAQRAYAHRKAQAILLSHIPASSAIFMGPGGRQSCQRALICVHEEICQPSTSLDLVLTVVLKLCDIAAR